MDQPTTHSDQVIRTKLHSLIEEAIADWDTREAGGMTQPTLVDSLTDVLMAQGRRVWDAEVMGVDLADIQARDRAAVARMMPPEGDPLLRAEMDRRILLDLVKSLSYWKRDAIQLLAYWELVFVALGEPGQLGSLKTQSSLAEVNRLLAENTRMKSQMEAIRALYGRFTGENRAADYMRAVHRLLGEPTE